MRKSPEVGDVFSLIKSQSAKWNDIATELKVDDNTRTSVRQDTQLGKDGKLDQILQTWNEAQTSDVTWEKIIEVLKSMKLNKTAGEVKQFLKEPNIIKKYNKAPDFKP